MPSRVRRGLVAALAAGMLGSGVAAVGAAAPAAAAPASVTVTNASLAWGFSAEQGGGSFFGGCNFLSAGAAGNTGSSRLWTQADGFYQTVSGNVTVEKPNAAGAYVRPTWTTKCQTPQGTPVNAASATSVSSNRVVFRAGTGTVDRAANTATIRWSGAVTSVFYGGLTYWTAANPVLTVRADGTAVLTATASGYGADRHDSSTWVPLAARTVTLANLRGVSVSATGFTVTPDYLGVKVSVPGGTTPQVARSAANAGFWGSFPPDFIDFQQLTGQASYWFTSGGSRDPAKRASALTVGYTLPAAPATPVEQPATPQPVATPTASSPPVTAAPTPAQPTAAPSPLGSARASLTVSDASVPAGASVAFTASGFAPYESVGVVVHSDPVELAPVTADRNGVVSASRVIPLNVPAGSHHLVLTGTSSRTQATSALAVSAAATSAPSAAGTTAASPPSTAAGATAFSSAGSGASCTPTSSVSGGEIVWGFKRSYRSYVAAASGTSIIAGQGATILNQDLAIAGKPNSGTYRWPFSASSSFTSGDAFTVQYAGAVNFRYPAHYFDLTVANPKLVLSGGSGTLYADVKLISTLPGKPASANARTAVALASVTAGPATTTANGISRTLSLTLKDTQAFMMNGSAFYQQGQRLDDATVLLAGCATASGGGGAATPVSAGGSGTPTSGDDDLVPEVQFRDGSGDADSASDELPYTGFRVDNAFAVAACACAAGLFLLTVATRRNSRTPAGTRTPAGDER